MKEETLCIYIYTYIYIYMNIYMNKKPQSNSTHILLDLIKIEIFYRIMTIKLSAPVY